MIKYAWRLFVTSLKGLPQTAQRRCALQGGMTKTEVTKLFWNWAFRLGCWLWLYAYVDESGDFLWPL